MVRITIDEAMRKKLFASDGVVELVDESGRLLGRLLPEVADFPHGWEPVTPELTEEELERLSKYEGPAISTEELLARLRRKRDNQ